MLSYLIKIHIVCEKGYSGTNCDTLCVYPSYGLDCQSSCNCTAKQCDHANGCTRHPKGMLQFCLHVRLSIKKRDYYFASYELYFISNKHN